MRIAALYDIHGNLPALNALLDELTVVKPDVIVIGGDIVSGPMPARTLEQLSELGDQVRSIRGNADHEVVAAFDSLSLTGTNCPKCRRKGRSRRVGPPNS